MQPNVVFCLLDAARASSLSCYGYDRETTPFLDQLAAEGTRFDRAFANSIFSLPSYASIFTGEYPNEHGAVDWSRHIDRNELVAGLSERGYETHAVSTHLVSDDFGIGAAFDTVERLFEAGSLPFEDDPVADAMAEKAAVEGWDSPGERYRFFLQAVLRNPSFRSFANGAVQLGRRLRREFGFWSDDGGAAAVEHTKRVVSEAEEPFFCFTNVVETHDPYRPPRGYIRRFLPDGVGLDEIKAAIDYSSVRASVGLDEMDADRRRIIQALYDAELAYVDDQLADLYAFLQDRGYLENTVFVVCADHGDYFGEHDLWGHQGRIATQVCHVPLVVSYPWESEGVVSEVVELRQLCDHLLSIADGDRTPLAPAGEALVEYYGWDTQLSFDPWERFERVEREPWAAYECMLLDEDYALRWDAREQTQLYDVRTDFEGTTDIAPEHPEVVQDYQERIAALVGTPRENHERYRSGAASGSGFEETDDAVQDRLRDLGYMG